MPLADMDAAAAKQAQISALLDDFINDSCAMLHAGDYC
jgi:hypothetical protein